MNYIRGEGILYHVALLFHSFTTKTWMATWIVWTLLFQSQGLPQKPWMTTWKPHGLRGRSGSCGWCWRMINAWKDRHQSAVRRRNRRLNNHMIETWSGLFARENYTCSRKSKYILNNTSKTHNLNILRSYNANWTHFWHLHPSIGIFCPNSLFFLSSHPNSLHSLYCVQKNWSPHLYFFFLAPFFSFFSFFLFVGTFFFFLPTDFRLPFNLAWNIKMESNIQRRRRKQECG